MKVSSDCLVFTSSGLKTSQELFSESCNHTVVNGKISDNKLKISLDLIPRYFHEITFSNGIVMKSSVPLQVGQEFSINDNRKFTWNDCKGTFVNGYYHLNEYTKDLFPIEDVILNPMTRAISSMMSTKPLQSNPHRGSSLFFTGLIAKLLDENNDLNFTTKCLSTKNTRENIMFLQQLLLTLGIVCSISDTEVLIQEKALKVFCDLFDWRQYEISEMTSHTEDLTVDDFKVTVVQCVELPNLERAYNLINGGNPISVNGIVRMV